MFRNTLLCLLLFLTLTRTARTQPLHFGQFPIQYFSAEAYGAHPQNWAAAQDTARGLLYFGNYRGLLEFDGQHWRLFHLPNGTAVRSLHVDAASGRIYAGGQGEFGYFKPDARGALAYVSLSDSLPVHERSFADVWSILPPGPSDGGLHFVTAQRIFEFQADQYRGAIQPAPGGEYEFGFACRGRKFVCTLRIGLCEIKAGRTPLVDGGAAFAHQNISLMLPIGRMDFLIGTKDPARLYRYDGIYARPWPDDGNAWPHESSELYRGLILHDSLLVLATRQFGAFVLNLDGQGIAQINRGPDLPNDNILALCADQAGNLWLGLENGIAQVEIRSPLRQIMPQSSSPKTWGVNSAVFGENLYLITGNGLFFSPLEQLRQPFGSKQFAEIEKAKGEALSLTRVGEQLFLGHHEGTFLVEKSDVRKIADEQGGWVYRPLPGHPDCWIGGHYHGLVLYRRRAGGDWTAKKLDGLDDIPCRLLEVEETDKGIIVWVSHVYKGVYRILLNDNLTEVAQWRLFTRKEKLPDNFGTNVFRIDAQIVFATRKGIFRFDDDRQVFEQHPALTPYFGDNFVSRLTEDAAGNLWCVVNGQVWHFLKAGDGGYKRDPNPWLSKLDDCLQENFEHLHLLNSGQLLVGAQPSFLLFNTDFRPQQTAPFRVLIREVKALDPTALIFGGHFSRSDGAFSADQAAGTWQRLSAGTRNLRFTFAAPYFDRQNKTLFRHWLKGSQRDTSEWSAQTIQEYSNLPAGRYEFLVWAKNASGEISEAGIYRFEIRRSRGEYAIWAAGVLMLALLVFTLWKRWQDAQIIAKQDKTIRESAQDRNLLLTQILHTPVLLRTVLDTFAALRRNPIPAPDLENVAASVRDHLQQLEARENRMIFLQLPWIIRLQRDHPDLTATDLQYLYFIDSGLSNREIAEKMGVTEGAVKNRETAIRKRLDMPRADLRKFLTAFKT